MSLAVPFKTGNLVPAASGEAGSRADQLGDGTGQHLDGRVPNLSAFESVYGAWFADVLGWIRAFGAPAADHDDLLQEVFVVVHRRLPDFDGRNLAGWLYRITARQVRDHRRLRWVRTVLRRSVPVSDRLEAPGPSPLMVLETREKQALLDRLLDHLREPLRVAFVLFEIEGYTGEEIAELQQVPINTVRARIHRARKRLLELLIVWRKRADGAGLGRAESSRQRQGTRPRFRSSREKAEG
ncbi:MAG TPA: RNA polymerase sigma factor [Polyangia bacterium]|nr:RNA polymerase sigma factor [Polyangia bacterium]